MNKLRNTIKDNGKGLIGFMLFTVFFFVFAIMIDTAFAQVNDTIGHGNGTAKYHRAVEGTIANPVQNSTPGSNANPPQSMAHHTTTLALNSIPSIVNVSQSITVTGSLIDANTSDGIPGATINFDGDGVTNPGSVSTDNQGSFSYDVVMPDSVHTGLRIDAGYDGGSSKGFIYDGSFKVLTIATNMTRPPNTSTHPTNLTLNSIPSIVNVSQSITVTGSLIDANTTDGIPDATINFDGDGVTNPGSVSTDNQGSFSFNTTALPDIHKGLKVQAHFAGDLPSQQYTYGHSPSDSNIRTYDTTNICPNPPGCKTSPSITITSVSNIKPKAEVDTISVSGTTTNATHDYTVTVDWGDGTPLSNGIQLNSDGSWGNGQVTHKYKSADVGNNPYKNVVATLVTGEQDVPNPNDTRVVQVQPPLEVGGGNDGIQSHTPSPSTSPFPMFSSFWILPALVIAIGAIGGGLALYKRSRTSSTPGPIQPINEDVVEVITQGGIEDLQKLPVNAPLIPNDTGTRSNASEEAEVITQGGIEG